MKNKTLKKIVIVLIAILVIELIYFGIKYIKVRKESTYYSIINSTIKVDDKYVSVGLSDFKHSKFNKYKAPGYNKATLFVYDKNLKLTNEVYLDLGLTSEYKDIVKVDDGYIAVGSVLMDEKSKEDNLTEAVIVKYDNDFNIVWRKNLNILDTSKFNKVKVDKDGNYVVVGTSVYAPNMIGNHTTGGAIIVKYDKNGEVLSKINLGGPQTGEFNDLVITNDGYVVVGLKATGTGAIYKYSFDGKEIWHNYYGITDKEGLTSIKMLSDGSFIVTGSKLEEKNKTDNYEAALIKFDKNGKLVKSIVYQKEDITKFTYVETYKDKILVIGLYGVKKNNLLVNNSVLVTYDSNLEKQDEKVYKGNNTYTLKNIFVSDDEYVLSGHTNSKLKDIKTNGKDYYNVIIKNS